MRILLTGAAGFVGHHMLEHLIRTTDHEIVVTDSFRHRGMSARLRAVIDGNPGCESRVHVVTHDLRTPIDVITAEHFGQVDVIINMASESHVDRSIEQPRTFIENNVALALTMLDYARTLPDLKLFVQISTDEVYGPAPTNYAHVEYDAIIPSNPYAASKAAQEAIAISYWRTYNLPIVLSNTMNIIGERQDVEKFLPKTIASILSGHTITVHGKFDAGNWISGSRYYLHARNQADAILYIINRFTAPGSQTPLRFSEKLTRPPRFHVVGEREVSNEELVHLVAEILNKDAIIDRTDFHSSRPGHDLRYALAPGVIGEIGWKPPIPFRDSLEKTVRWYLAHPEWLREY